MHDPKRALSETTPLIKSLTGFQNLRPSALETTTSANAVEQFPVTPAPAARNNQGGASGTSSD